VDDRHHEKCVDRLKTLREPLVTVWPPLVEAVYLLGDLPKAQEAVWEMLARGAVQLMSLGMADIPRIRELMIINKYADQPMDLADAAIVRVAEREGIRRIFTVDRNDFGVYRLHGRVGLSIVVRRIQEIDRFPVLMTIDPYPCKLWCFPCRLLPRLISAPIPSG
jgi:predicted nucleic acid-binding protein